MATHGPVRALILAGFLLGSGSALSAERSYAVDPARTRVEFSVDATGFAGASGTMKVRTGTLELDPADPGRARLTLALDANSIDTGLAARDQAIRGSSFLNVEAFPEIRFTTRAVYPDGPRHATVLGDLEMIGVTKPLAIDTGLVDATSPGDPLQFSGRAKLSRSDWGMTAFLPLVGDEVQISFQLTAMPSP